MSGLPYLRKLSLDDFKISVILSLRVLKYGNISQTSWELNTRTFSFQASCATFDIRPMVSLMALGYGLYILRLWPLCFHSQPADGSLLPHSSRPLSSSSSIHPISGGPPLSAHKGPGISPGNYLVDEKYSNSCEHIQGYQITTS